MCCTGAFFCDTQTCIFYFFSLKTLKTKQNMGPVNVLSRSVVIKLRIDAAVLPCRSWVGLQRRPPGPRGAESRGTVLRALESHTSECHAFPVVSQQISSPVVVHSPGVWCAPPENVGRLLSSLWGSFRDGFPVCCCWTQCRGLAQLLGCHGDEQR